MLLKNLNQKRIIFSESGADRWHAAGVARAILRRIEKQETVIVNRFDVDLINRMAQVLGASGRFNNPFQSGIWEQQTEIRSAEIMRLFK